MEKRVSPVWQFISLLAPIVMTGFYLVYALVGLVIDGKTKLKWSDEALEVGLFVLLIVLVINGLVLAFAWYHRLKMPHALWISPMVHIGLSVSLTAMIFFID